MTQPLRQKLLVRFALSRPVAVAIHLFAAIAQLAHGKIDEDVARPGVEGSNLLAGGRLAEIDGSNVADAADVVHANMAILERENHEMKGSRQRRALSASGEIRCAKIAHDGHTEALHKVSRLADLQRGRI